MADITIRLLRDLDDMRRAAELQKIYWGDDTESLVPAHMMYSLATHGGHVLAAFDGSHMIGALIGFLGTSEENETRPAMANLQLVSKRLIVLPEYRSLGVGYRLKIAQRDFALKQGIRLVTWTFDPLLAPNAQLNVRKLGAVCQYYLVNYYGTDEESPLTTLGSSDRLLAEWWVTQRRVEERLTGGRPPLMVNQYLEANAEILNPSQPGAFLSPAAAVKTPESMLTLVEIPVNFPHMVAEMPDLAREWRGHLRDILQRQFAAGYVVTDFLRCLHEERERAFYVLSFSGRGSETFSSS